MSTTIEIYFFSQVCWNSNNMWSCWSCWMFQFELNPPFFPHSPHLERWPQRRWMATTSTSTCQHAPTTTFFNTTPTIWRMDERGLRCICILSLGMFSFFISFLCYTKGFFIISQRVWITTMDGHQQHHKSSPPEWTSMSDGLQPS